MEEDIGVDEIIQIVQNNEVPIQARLSGLKKLQAIGDNKCLLAIFNAARSETAEIVDFCNEVLQSASYKKLASLLDFVLEGGSASHLTEKYLLGLIYRFRDSDLLKYILSTGKSLGNVDPRKSRIIQLWLKESRAIDDYAQVIIAMPVDMAKKTARAFHEVAPQLTKEFSEMIAHLSPALSIKILDILSVLLEPGNSVPKPLYALLENSDPQIRSKAVHLIGRSSNNIMFFKRTIKDEDLGVQMSAISAMANLNWRSAKELIVPLLENYELNLRASAAQVAYEHAQEIGLSTLIRMFDPSDQKSCQLAINILGSVCELTMFHRIQEVASNSSDRLLRQSANGALKSMGLIAKKINAKVSETKMLIRGLEGTAHGKIRSIMEITGQIDAMPKVELATLLTLFEQMPKTTQSQIVAWASLLVSQKGMAALSLISFWENREIVTGVGELVVPSKFKRHMFRMSKAFKAVEKEAKTKFTDRLFQTSTQISRLIKG